jgi:spore maturation protein SpmB
MLFLFSSTDIKNTRNALVRGLIADFAEINAGILMAYLFFY